MFTTHWVYKTLGLTCPGRTMNDSKLVRIVMPNLFRHLLNYVHEARFRQEVLKQVQDDEERKSSTFTLDPF